MVDHDKAGLLRPLTMQWVSRHLAVGEAIVRTVALPGGITAEMRQLTVQGHDGSTRDVVLRSFVDPFYLEHAEDALNREADALTELTRTGVPAPRLLGVDPVAAHCEFPSLLMTHLRGRTVLDDAALEVRAVLLARQLMAIHAVHPNQRPGDYAALTTADTVVVPDGADAAAWAAAIELIRRPAPTFEARYLHRDFQPGNVLFDVPPTGPAGARIIGVVDWAAASWGPADLDVAHCSVNLALLHGPAWGLRFPRAYEQAGGALAPSVSDRLYWQVRDAMASSEEVEVVARLWRSQGRTDLTTRAVQDRLDAYVTALMHQLR